MQRGDLLFKADDVSGALEDFNLLLSRSSKNVAALLKRATVLKKVGRFAQAASDLLKLLVRSTDTALSQRNETSPLRVVVHN